MKKNIIIGLLTVVSLISIAYVFYSKSEADKLFYLLVEQEEIIEKNKDEIIKQKAIIQEQARLIEEQGKLIESKTQVTKPK